MSTPPRRVTHLDMDAYYASVELQHYPELRGLPPVIGGRRNRQPELLIDGSRRFFRLRDYVGRGVITTSTYEARALGVCSATGMMRAAKFVPDVILLPADSMPIAITRAGSRSPWSPSRRRTKTAASKRTST